MKPRIEIVDSRLGCDTKGFTKPVSFLGESPRKSNDKIFTDYGYNNLCGTNISGTIWVTRFLITFFKNRDWKSRDPIRDSILDLKKTITRRFPFVRAMLFV